LSNTTGGTGWQSGWSFQNNNNAIPGYQTSNGNLTYNTLQTLGNSGSGGLVYLGFGRRLNTSLTGPFQSYINDENLGIGSLRGDTLWVSILLNKINSNSQTIYLTAHNDNISWCDNCTSQHMGKGYYGASSDLGAVRHWSLRLNSTVYPTSIPILYNTITFLVMRIVFAVGSTDVSLYVKPSSLGNGGPPSIPTISQSIVSQPYIRSIATFLGESPNNGRMDEIRMAKSYSCVAPDNTVAVNLPPVANFTMTPSSGQAPLLVSLNGSSSVDPEGQSLTYLWNFGDGSLTQPGVTAIHSYDLIGNIPVTLTVTDNLGLQHTSTQAFTITNQYNTYSCQTSINCMNMATCTGNNGRLQVNSSNNYT
jgi:PKD repeat protein